MQYSIFIVDDEIEVCKSLQTIFISKGFNVVYETTPSNVMNVLSANKIDLMLIDIKMPEINGINLLQMVKKDYPNIQIIIISGYATVETAVKAMKYGAINIYTKPIDLDQLITEIQHIVNITKNKKISSKFDKIITNNPVMIDILKLVEMAANSEAPVIITGESGTGKELIADTLHHLSMRKNEPFIKINCASIPDNLLESEMFGYEKGAFTDAKISQKGKFELANKGSIFLDEIGEMSLKTQAKMLRVLQDKKVSRLGSNKVIETNCRIITATNKDLLSSIEQSSFREDLYYRLSVITFHLPPLRERKEDIFTLLEYFLIHFNKVYNKNITTVSQEIKEIVMKHNWPGNIREFKNFIERSIIFCNSEVFDTSCITEQYKKLLYLNEDLHFENERKTVDKKYIIEALEKTRGSKSDAAKLLNIDRKTLYNRMKKLDIT